MQTSLGDCAAAGDDEDSDDCSAYTTASKLEDRGLFGGRTKTNGKSYEPLRPGDEIMYTPAISVAGTNYKRAKVLSVSPSLDCPLVLSTNDVLSMRHQVKRISVIKPCGGMVDHSGIYRRIEEFQLEEGGTITHGDVNALQATEYAGKFEDMQRKIMNEADDFYGKRRRTNALQLGLSDKDVDAYDPIYEKERREAEQWSRVDSTEEEESDMFDEMNSLMRESLLDSREATFSTSIDDSVLPPSLGVSARSALNQVWQECCDVADNRGSISELKESLDLYLSKSKASEKRASSFVLFQFPGDLTPLTDSSKGLRFEKVYASVTTRDSFRRRSPARRRRLRFRDDAGLVSTSFACSSSKSFVTSPRPPRPRSTLAGGHRHECIRAGPPAGVALPKSIAEPYPAQTSIHPLSDDFPRLIGRGPGDGRYRDRAEPAEMSVHPRGVGQSHPDPSLQHQASQVPTNGERFRATPNLSLKVDKSWQQKVERRGASLASLDSTLEFDGLARSSVARPGPTEDSSADEGS
ncbi:hypothetical protein THAOC_01741 [Thalassiosira oceanica]|uniref:Uncharacterized protein n=1 Tax=Thalassiosira oceanica TaxID=159749 RepID=K0THK9_THAOC|nr:hypothetical protein THAOC_01741 [Thalassiosira oceanica]|eukprot:EJK76494.1 hypothetical protein THAOC_01741 [Thalassiosira oceanica]